MARYRGPRGKICRRLDYAAFESPKFSNPKKNYPPGEHGPTHRRRLSEYGIQMREKQRIKYTYGVLERQFRNYFKRADRQQGKTGDNLMKMLESRLDNVVYRLGFAPTRRAARQIVSHKHVLVNESVINIPSYQVKPGDVIRIREKSKRLDLILDAVKKSHENLNWLKLDKAKLSGEILHIPEREEIPQDFNEQLVVELYSK
ncbi:MAG: small subunit ribosomal protein [Candidatus Marinimicrobia bacterium]|jgi:small subunit ribosomal protein S4|nr:small subunit ribosomal protein [Candidatus Neomarinimicrobiota bacterium]